jgi:pyridoxal phosphate enzyme (YggS family)
MNRREELAENLAAVQARITNPAVTLIVVTKTFPASDVEILHGLGVTHFGENRNEEGLEKSSVVDATWHYQGEIQSRKLRDIAQWADVIHSLVQHVISQSWIRLQMAQWMYSCSSLDGDPARGGVIESELPALADAVLSSSHLQLKGLMSVPPVAADARTAFTEIAAIHRRFIARYPASTSLSAGMSGDFEIAVDCGATHIRVGSSILGSRTARS